MNDLLKDIDYLHSEYKYLNSVRLIKTKDKNYILKEKKKNLGPLFSYLDDRGFCAYIKPVRENENYELYEYLDDFKTKDTPNDLANTLASLHKKTQSNREVIADDVKKIYESRKKLIAKTRKFYQEKNDYIEMKTYYSPEEYLLIRNISQIYNSIDYSNNTLDKWYEIKEKSQTERVSQIHNNAELNHFVDNKLISWSKSSIDYPIYDFINFYKKNFLTIEPISLFENYQKNFKYTNDEYLLFSSILSLPDIIEYKNNHLENTIKTSKEIKYVIKTRNFLLKENEKYQSVNEDKFKKENDSI